MGERIKTIEKNIDAQKLEFLFGKFTCGEIERDDSDLIGVINYMKERYTRGNKYQQILSVFIEDEYYELHKALRLNNIFIWSKGDLETYFSKFTKSLKGTKDTKALEISSLLSDPNKTVDDIFIDYAELKDLVVNITKVN